MDSTRMPSDVDGVSGILVHLSAFNGASEGTIHFGWEWRGRGGDGSASRDPLRRFMADW